MNNFSLATHEPSPDQRIRGFSELKLLIKLCTFIAVFGCGDPAPDGKSKQDQGIDSTVTHDWAPPLPIVTDMRPIIGDSTLQDARVIEPDAQPPDSTTSPVDAQVPDAVIQACAAVDCSHLDDFCIVGTCDSASGDCYPRRKSDNEPCDDGRPCTTNTICTTGICGGGSPINCADMAAPCTVARCDPEQGCVAEPAANGAPCEMQGVCLLGGLCEEGACVGDPIDCSAFDGPCAMGGCDPITGECTSTPIADGQACDDGDGCTEATTCNAGVCGGGEGPDCSMLDGPCAVGRCEGDGCVIEPVPDGTQCGDPLDQCTQAAQCQGGVCLPGGPIDCDDEAGACAEAVCRPAEGCVVTPLAECLPCDAGLCGGGQCQAWGPGGGARYDFEGQLDPSFQTNGDRPWVLTNAPHTGAHSFGSGDIDDDEISRLTRVIDYDQRVDVIFWYRVSSEDNYDFFRFSIDGNPAFERSGDTGWQEARWGIPAGRHTLSFVFERDDSAGRGADRAWIDDMEILVPCVDAPGYQISAGICLDCP